MSENSSFTCYLPIIGETIKYIDQCNNSSQNERFHILDPSMNLVGVDGKYEPWLYTIRLLVYGKTKNNKQKQNKKQTNKQTNKRLIVFKFHKLSLKLMLLFIYTRL